MVQSSNNAGNFTNPNTYHTGFNSNTTHGASQNNPQSSWGSHNNHNFNDANHANSWRGQWGNQWSNQATWANNDKQYSDPWNSWQGSGTQSNTNNWNWNNSHTSSPWNNNQTSWNHPNAGFNNSYHSYGSNNNSFQSHQNSQCSVSVCETAEEFNVTAEIPGVEEKDCEVFFQNGLLTFRGERKVSEEEKKNMCWQMSDRHFGRFSRSINLSETAGMIDETKVTAKFSPKGLLHVTLPKKKQSSTGYCKVPFGK